MNGKKEESKMGELLAKIVGSLESGERKDSTSSNRNNTILALTVSIVLHLLVGI